MCDCCRLFAGGGETSVSLALGRFLTPGLPDISGLHSLQLTLGKFLVSRAFEVVWMWFVDLGKATELRNERETRIRAST